MRNKIGAGGYVIEGIVTRANCAPVPHARIEFWLVNPEGNYDDHRATVVADDRGQYRLDTTRPGCTKFKVGLFGMEPPRRGPVLSIVDEIRMEIELAAKARG